MILANLGGKGLVYIRCKWVGALGFAWHEEVVAIASLLVKVQLNIGFPVVEYGESPTAGRMLVSEPVSIEIEPVVIGASVGNCFSVLSIIWVGTGVLPAMTVSPVGKAVEPVGVLHGRKNDYNVLKLPLDLVVINRIQVVGNEGRGIGATGFIAVNAIHHMKNRGLVGDIDLAAWIDNRSTGRFDVGKLREVGW